MYNFTVLLFCNVYFKESLKVRIFEREKKNTKTKDQKKKMVKDVAGSGLIYVVVE